MNQRKEELRKRRKGFVSLLTAAMIASQMMPFGVAADWIIDDYSIYPTGTYEQSISTTDMVRWTLWNSGCQASIYYLDSKEGFLVVKSLDGEGHYGYKPEAAKLPSSFTDEIKGDICGWKVSAKTLINSYNDNDKGVESLRFYPQFGIQYKVKGEGGNWVDYDWNDTQHDKVYTYGTGLEKLASPSAGTGYVYNWYEDEAFEHAAGSTAENPAINSEATKTKTFYGKKTPVNYTISYNGIDGITNATGKIAAYTIESNDFTLFTPSRLGYTFIGWTDDSLTGTAQTPATAVTIAKGTTGDLSYTAHWKKNLSNNDETGFEITLDIPTGGYIYDGNQKTPAVTVVDKESRETLTEDTDYTVTYGENINAGENSGTVTITAIGGSDQCAGETTVTFEIQKVSPNLQITMQNAETSETIDASEAEKDKEYPAYYYGTKVTPDITGVPENANVTIEYYHLLTTEEREAIQAELAAKGITDNDADYDDQFCAAVEAKFGGKFDGESYLTYDDENLPKHPGVYEIYVSSDPTDNFKDGWTYSLFTIIKKPVSVKANDMAISFNAAAPAYTATISGLAYNEKVEDVISGKPELTCDYTQGNNAGKYDITVSKGTLSAENYEFTTFTKGTLTVTKGETSITNNSANSFPFAIEYGEDYDDPSAANFAITDDQTPTFTWLDENGDALPAGTRPTDAGKYTLAVTAGEGNYKETTENFEFEIVPRKILVSPLENIVITYGDDLPETIKVTYSNILESDKALFPAELPVSSTYQRFGDAKFYEGAVTPTGITNPNYQVTYLPTNLTVNPKAITLTWDEVPTFIYDKTAKTVTGSIPEDDILNNDDVTLKFSGNTATGAGSNIATAELTGEKKDNYELNATDLPWNIEKAPITPSVTIADWAYGAEPNEPVVEGNPGNGKVTYTYFDMDDNELEGVPTGVGTYIVQATIAETANYAEGKAKTVFEITKAEIQKDDPTFQIITKPFEGVYDGKAHAVSVSAPAQIAGAKVYFSATDQTEEEFVEANQTASPEYINAGEYTVYYCITSPHYETVFGTATVTIQKRGITVTAVDQTSTLGEALKSLTYRLDGEIVKGDDLGIKLTSDADKDTLGTSEIKVTYTENANYTVKTVDGTYTVAEASEPSSDPEEPASDPEEPASDPEEPASDPEEPASDPEEPASDPGEPASEPGSEPASEPASTPGSTPSTKTSTDAASTPASEPASTPASDPASTPATKATTAATTKSTTTATTKTTTAVTTKTTTAATTKTTTTASTNSTTDASTTGSTPATTLASTKDTAPATTPATTSSTPASTLPTTQDTDAGTTTAATTTTQPSTEDGTDDVNTTTAPETTDDSGTGKTPHTTEPVLVEYDLKLTVIGKDKAYYAHDPNVFKAEDLIASLRRRTVSTDGQMCEWQDVTDFSCIDMRGQSPQSLYNEAQKNFIFAPIMADITTTLPDGRVVKQEISLGSVLIAQEGDVNLDGKLNALDSYIVLVNAALAGAGLPTQYFGGDDEELEHFARFIADVNGDGIADSIDAQAMLMFAAYLGSGEQPTWAKILEILFSNT